MATINEIPDDVLTTHILPLATEEEKLRQKITDLEELICILRENEVENEKENEEKDERIASLQKLNIEDRRRLKYYKGQVDYLCRQFCDDY